MKKTLFLLLLGATSILIAGCTKNTPATPSLPPEVPEALNATENPDQIVDTQLTQYQFEALLEDVANSGGSGTVMAGFIENEYRMIAPLENLPDPEGTDFYEGWIVRPAPLSIISTGVAEKSEDGTYTNTFIDSKDLTDHSKYVLTLEPDDGDPAPAKHILEGIFQAL